MSEEREVLKELREIKELIILEQESIEKGSEKVLMKIPGHKVNGNDKIKYDFGKIQEVPNLGIKKGYFDNLLAPTARAVVKKKKGKKFLKITGVSIIKTCYNLNQNDFKFFYNFDCNSSGEYQLSIYMTYNRKELKYKDYSFYPFKMKFYNGSILCAEGTSISIEEIKTVQLFLINRDPKTSRGTETPVRG